jgi:peroxiredoxin
MKDDLALGKQAPDFVINDFNGQSIQLLNYRGRKNIVLAFLRGFS